MSECMLVMKPDEATLVYVQGDDVLLHNEETYVN